MAFLEDVKKYSKAFTDEKVGSNVKVVPGKGVLVEGHKGIVSYSKALIELRFYSCRCSVTGSNMKIDYMMDSEMLILGEVSAISFTK